ncbi:MAG TPA: phosphate ABC transporter substrate-binding protein PstS [Gammaproteobacteria bacterium]|nr:phosphate ABC transporter substrate-binding protein PstS [Gammaproteobacteria bacterium]
MLKITGLSFMSALVLLAVGLAGGASAAEVKMINGAGATFPYPIYAKWAEAYRRETGMKLNYQSIGSGGGIKQIKSKTVDFGASDAPLKPADLDEAGLMQFPMIIGGVVPVVNLPGIGAGEIRLTPAVLADIYLGKIRKWNDEAIRSLNPAVDLPAKSITVVHRSDGSGTTWIFTNYLAKVSGEWAHKVGFNKAVAWPTGVGGKGNEGVASYVKRIKGAIGYVEYAYALQNRMSHVKLRNHDGNFVDPTSENFQAAAAGADWAHTPGFYLVLTNQPGAKAWPISGASFILMYKRQAKPEVARAVLKFFDWAYRHGAEMAESLHYVPIPESVYNLVEKTWAEQIKGPDGSPVWSGPKM